MGKAEFAESILQTTTTPEAAASIAGDLVQEANELGMLWFWSSLFRTTASLAYRTFATAPFRLAGMAIAGAIFQQVRATVLFLCLEWWLALVTRTTIVHPFAPFPPFHPLSVISNVASWLVAAYLLGKWLGRKVPHRELPVYVMTWAIYQLLWLVVPTRNWMMYVVGTIGWTIVTLVGVQRARRLKDGARP